MRVWMKGREKKAKKKERQSNKQVIIVGLFNPNQVSISPSIFKEWKERERRGEERRLRGIMYTIITNIPK